MKIVSAHFLPAVIVLLSILVCLYRLSQEPNALLSDELFPFFQAMSLREGSLKWFEFTQPFLYPALLAALPGKGVFVFRMFSLVMCLFAAWVMYRLQEKHCSESAALLCPALFLVNSAVIRASTLVLPDMVLTVAIVLSFGLYLKIYDERHATLRDSVVLASLLGCSSLVALEGLLFSFFFLWSLNRRGAFSLRNLLYSIAIILSFLLFYVTVSKTYLFGNVPLSALVQPRELRTDILIDNLGPATFLLFGIAVLGSSLRPVSIISGKLILFIAASIIVLDPSPEAKQFIVLVPFACFSAADAALEATGGRRAIIACCLLLYFAYSVYGLVKYQPGSTSTFLLEPQKNNCEEISSIIASCSGKQVKLPFLSLRPNQTCDFAFRSRVRMPEAIIVINYIDDKAKISINGKIYSHDNPNSPAVVRFRPRFNDFNDLSLSVTNSSGLGGIGQILICSP